MERQANICSNKVSINTTIEKVIDEMEKGKESTKILRNILLENPRLNVDGVDHDYLKSLDHHCMVTLTSFLTSLSLIRRCDFNGDLVGKRKILVDDDDDDHCAGSQLKDRHLYGEVPSHPTDTKNGRGSYKRRKINEGRIEEVTNLREDGFGWRKYGQKVILNAKHPRNYYRCTHKFDKKCPATKQVQQISDNPTKYRIIYHGTHICDYNLLNQSPIVIDDDDTSESQHPSTIVLRFDQKNQVNPLLFPNAASPEMKQEYNSPPLSDQSTSQDQTVTTGHSSLSIVSEQSDLVSTAENQAEDDSMWTDLEVLHDLFDC